MKFPKIRAPFLVKPYVYSAILVIISEIIMLLSSLRVIPFDFLYVPIIVAIIFLYYGLIKPARFWVMRPKPLTPFAILEVQDLAIKGNYKDSLFRLLNIAYGLDDDTISKLDRATIDKLISQVLQNIR